MADRVRKVNYCYITVPSRAGAGARILSALKSARINMLAFCGFPAGGGKAQLDVVAENIGAVRRVAAKNGWTVSAGKKAFLVQGSDRVGALEGHLQRLADAGISVTASCAVAGGGGRYGMVLWVKPRDFNRAAKALRVK